MKDNSELRHLKKNRESIMGVIGEDGGGIKTRGKEVCQSQHLLDIVICFWETELITISDWIQTEFESFPLVLIPPPSSLIISALMQ